jgi:hypothetical protein
MGSIDANLIASIDSQLRQEATDRDDSLEDMHLSGVAIVGLYESLDPDIDDYVAVTGSGSSALHVGLLVVGKASLLDG